MNQRQTHLLSYGCTYLALGLAIRQHSFLSGAALAAAAALLLLSLRRTSGETRPAIWPVLAAEGIAEAAVWGFGAPALKAVSPLFAAVCGILTACHLLSTFTLSRMPRKARVSTARCQLVMLAALLALMGLSELLVRGLTGWRYGGVLPGFRVMALLLVIHQAAAIAAGWQPAGKPAGLKRSLS
jgi:hypothetical protein